MSSLLLNSFSPKVFNVKSVDAIICSALNCLASDINEQYILCHIVILIKWIPSDPVLRSIQLLFSHSTDELILVSFTWGIMYCGPVVNYLVECKIVGYKASMTFSGPIKMEPIKFIQKLSFPMIIYNLALSNWSNLWQWFDIAKPSLGGHSCICCFCSQTAMYICLGTRWIQDSPTSNLW